MGSFFYCYFESIITTNAEPGLATALNYAAPDFNPNAGSPATTGAVFTETKLTGFETVA